MSTKSDKATKVKENLEAYVLLRRKQGFRVDQAVLDHLKPRKSARRVRDLEILMVYMSDVDLFGDFN